jgi:hypothetical protein
LTVGMGRDDISSHCILDPGMVYGHWPIDRALHRKN